MAKKGNNGKKLSAKNIEIRPVSDMENEIRQRAHEIYVRRCQLNIPGNSISDWITAESEIKAKNNRK